MGRPQDFLSCQLQNIPGSSVTSFLLVALIAITDLFLKLGVDISRTAINTFTPVTSVEKKSGLKLGDPTGQGQEMSKAPC